MNNLYFSTSNARKIKEAKAACEPNGITILPISLDIEEIQNIDGKKVAEHKAMEAFSILKKPVVVNDAYWSMPVFNGFPGAYMKDIDIWFSIDDWQNLLSDKNRNIICHENVVFADKNGKLHWFGNNYPAIFVNEPSGSDKNSNLEKLISFDGGKTTIANLHDKGELAIDPAEYCWADFSKWYKKTYLNP